MKIEDRLEAAELRIGILETVNERLAKALADLTGRVVELAEMTRDSVGELDLRTRGFKFYGKIKPEDCQ